MKIHSSFLISLLCTVGLIACGYVVIRKRGISIELTKNAADNARAREKAAKELLLTYAANPKLTVEIETNIDRSGSTRRLVLAVVNRRVLWLILSPSANASRSPYSLLEKLGDVDVEPVVYSKRDLPTLISELINIQAQRRDSPLTEDLETLIEALKQGEDKGSSFIFY